VAVYAKECRLPSGEEPVEWLLLTSLLVADFPSACIVVQWYRCRWEIELFFRVLKRGCQIEQLRLQTDQRLLNAMALCELPHRGLSRSFGTASGQRCGGPGG
jgi:Transposase DDE domain